MEVLIRPPTPPRLLRDFLTSQAVPGCDDLSGGTHRRPVAVDEQVRTFAGRLVRRHGTPAAGGLVLDAPPGTGRQGAEQDAARLRHRLLALPGIGPWTAGSITLRVLGDPDVSLPQDLVLRRALGVTGTAAAAEAPAAWNPGAATP